VIVVAHCVNQLVAIAAHERRHVAVVDIGSAFLNATMQKSVPVLMRLDKITSEYLVYNNPKYAEFRQANGRSQYS
jgi:hypothetical protein